MQFELAAGGDLLAAVIEVGLLPVLLRSAAGEVLRHGADRSGAEARALEAADVRGAQLARQVGILAEGLQLPRPARLGREVDLRVQGDADADGGVLAAGDVGEPLDEVGVGGGGEAERLGPLRERAGEQSRAGVLAEAVAGVGGDRHGDAETRGREFLQPVVPARDEGRVAGDHQQVEVAHVAADDIVLVRGDAEVRVARRELAVIAHGDHGLEEEAGLLLEGHLAEEDLDPLIGGEARVAVAGVDGGRGGVIAHADSMNRTMLGFLALRDASETPVQWAATTSSTASP